MNILSKFRLPLFLLTVVAVMTSCSDNDEATPVVPVASKTIVDVAVADPQFSILVSALQKADLVNTLKSSGPFTVFAPNNAAFSILFSQLGVTGIDELSAEALRPILLNHVVTGKIMSSEITSGYVATANNSGPASASVKVLVQKSSGVTVDGSSVTMADVAASNGVIHVVDRVILPASVVSHAINNPDFSILVQAVVKAGLVEALSADGPFTVFAPTNTAFNNLFAALGVNGLDDLSVETLTPILLYHVVSGNILSSQVATGMVATLKEGSSIDVMVSGGSVKLNSSSNVVAVDVQGTNGVVHAIDAVLLP